ncbi:helix-turn-helix transcriptional regulator [Niallia taxi]|uniref:helix-turn-helix transcriptional regulator n=1 Tax=Niallia taxi TaxID=2499688 RepID=UPI003F625366
MLKSNIGILLKNSPLKREYIMQKLNVTANTLSNWSTGKRKPSIDNAFELAKILECKVDDLYTLEEES